MAEREVIETPCAGSKPTALTTVLTLYMLQNVIKSVQLFIFDIFIVLKFLYKI